MIYILFALLGAGVGWAFATQTRSNSLKPEMAAGIGAVGGLVGGAIIKLILPLVLGLVAVVLGAVAAVYLWNRYRATA